MSDTEKNPLANSVTEAMEVFDGMAHELTLFMEQIANWCSKHPKMLKGNPPIIHSVKSRLKSRAHLEEKLGRKYCADGQLTFSPADLGSVVTDLSGVRILHLHQAQFVVIHTLLTEKIASGDWYKHEEPVAYTWDPESQAFFESLGLECRLRDTYYTSVHYVVRPREGSFLNCEIQVRTLFEEIWGEVDHSLNYPEKTTVIACKEQLRVLSKLVGAGSRLVDSIFRT